MRARQVFALAAAIAVCAAPDALAEPEPLIAYESFGEIKLVKPDGTERRLLTRPSARTDAFDPAWSPDGGTLAFARVTDFDDPSDRPEVSRLVAVDLASGTSRVVASDAGGGAAFSADGRSVAYSASFLFEGEEYTSALRVVATDGSGNRVLTRPSANHADYTPAWAPDGGSVAFTRFTRTRDGGRSDIWTVPASGGEPRLLIADAEDPDWSPDGQRIAFTSTRDENGTTCFHDCSPNGEIYVADADGANARRVTFADTDERAPAWSPDGGQIAFHSARPRPEGNDELYAMRPDGTCVTRLTNTSVSNRGPVWRPGSAYGAPLECDSAVPGALTASFETDLSPALRFRRHPLAWLGESYDDALLSAADAGDIVTMIYDDCGRVVGECPLEGLQVQTSTLCGRHPLRYGGYSRPGAGDIAPHARRYARVGNALVADYGGESGVDVYTGRIGVTLFGPTFEQALAIVAELKLFPGDRSALSAPRFPARILARVRAVNRELRRLGMRELSRRWRMSRDQIRAAQKLRAVLSSAELRRGTSRCG